MFDDDKPLWDFALRPLLCERSIPTQRSVLDIRNPLKPIYLLPFLRSVRTSMITGDSPEELYERLRSLLLLETLHADNYYRVQYDCDPSPLMPLELLASVLRYSLRHRLPLLRHISIPLGQIHMHKLPEISRAALSDSIASIPNPQQVRQLHLQLFKSLSTTVLEAFTRLEELNVRGCGTITNVHFCAASLRRLNVSFCSLIDNDGLARATELEVLHVCGCRYVTTVAPFAATLTELHAEGTCGLTDAGLKDATGLRRLFIQGNTKITTVAPFAAVLRELYAADSGIGDDGLKEATSLVKLTTSGEITTVKPFAKTLRELDIAGSMQTGGTASWVHVSPLNDEGLRDAVGVVKIEFRCQCKVTTVEPFAKTLREAIVGDCKTLSDDGLRHATAIVRLNASSSRLVTTVKPFAATLLELDASLSAITDSGLHDATSLVKLSVDDNPLVTTVATFAATLRVLHAFSFRFNCIGDEGLKDAVSLSRLFETSLLNVHQEHLPQRRCEWRDC